MGWHAERGAATGCARSGFTALLTADRNLEHQQNVSRSGLALIVLRARSNRLPDLLPLVPRLLAVLPGARMGQVAHVAANEALRRMTFS